MKDREQTSNRNHNQSPVPSFGAQSSGRFISRSGCQSLIGVLRCHGFSDRAKIVTSQSGVKRQQRFAED